MTTIESAQAQLAKKVMGLSGVAGLAIGESAGVPCIKVLVLSRTPDVRAKIPTTFRGYNVIVEETDEFRAQS